MAKALTLKGKPKAPAIPENIQGILDAYKAQYKVDCPLSIEDIIATVEAHDGDEMNAAQWAIALYEAVNSNGEGDDDNDSDDAVDDDDADNTPTTKKGKDTSATTMDKTAIAVGERIGQSTVLKEDIQNFTEHKNGVRRGPAMFLFHLQKEFTAEEMSLWPVPNSTKEDAEKARKPGTNTPLVYDNRGQGKGSWYADVYDSTPWGKADAARIAELKDLDNRISKDDLSMVNQSRTNGIALMRTAVKCFFNMQTLANTPGCELRARFRVTKDKDGKPVLSRSTSPVSIYDPENSDNTYFKSVGEFNRIMAPKSWAEVIKNAGEGSFFQHFKAPRKPRVKGGDAATTAAQVTVPRVTKTSKGAMLTLDMFSELGDNFDQDKDGSFLRLIDVQLNAAGSDPYLLAVEQINIATTKLLKRPAYQQRLQVLHEMQQEEAKPELAKAS